MHRGNRMADVWSSGSAMRARQFAGDSQGPIDDRWRRRSVSQFAHIAVRWAACMVVHRTSTHDHGPCGGIEPENKGTRSHLYRRPALRDFNVAMVAVNRSKTFSRQRLSARQPDRELACGSVLALAGASLTST